MILSLIQQWEWEVMSQYTFHLCNLFTEAGLPMTSLESWGLYLSVQRVSSQNKTRQSADDNYCCRLNVASCTMWEVLPRSLSGLSSQLFTRLCCLSLWVRLSLLHLGCVFTLITDVSWTCCADLTPATPSVLTLYLSRLDMLSGSSSLRFRFSLKWFSLEDSALGNRDAAGHEKTSACT